MTVIPMPSRAGEGRISATSASSCFSRIAGQAGPAEQVVELRVGAVVDVLGVVGGDGGVDLETSIGQPGDPQGRLA